MAKAKKLKSSRYRVDQSEVQEVIVRKRKNRRELPDGTIEEFSAMGKIITVPFQGPMEIDLREEAIGWIRLFPR